MATTSEYEIMTWFAISILFVDLKLLLKKIVNHNREKKISTMRSNTAAVYSIFTTGQFNS